MTRATCLLLVGLAMGLACACSPSQAPEAGQVAPRSWIDAPLQGSVLPLGPVGVVSHSSRPEAIARIELSVDGTVVANQSGPGPTEGLVTAQQVWHPDAPGRYVLRVRASDAGGVWGDYAEVEVEVMAEQPAATATPAPTVTPTATPTPAPTATPVPAATLLRVATAAPAPPTATPAATPVPLPPPQPTAPPVSRPTIGGPDVSSAEFYYGAGGCAPQEMAITVRVTDESGVAGVRVYFRLLDKASSATTPWAYLDMAPGTDGWTSTVVAATHIPRYNAFAHAWFQFYFLATNNQGAQTKSPGYWTGFTLSRCGS